MQGMAGILPLILLLLIMYFLLIRPQKKREKQINAMRSAIQVGDEIITIGGICGKVVKTKEETLVIQVGADKTKFEVMRWAISKVVNEKEEAAKETKTEEAPKKSMPKRLGKKAEETPVEETPAEETVAEEAPEKDEE